MRKASRVLISVVIFLQACSALPFLGAAQPVNAPVATQTLPITFTPGIVPTSTITPSITPSPTIIRFPTQDPNAPIPIYIGSVTATPFSLSEMLPVATALPAISVSEIGYGFISVEVSEEKIFWGSCKPNKAKVIAEVQDPKEVISVVIFVQVKSALKEDYTPWTTGDVMFNHRDGTFSYTLQANEIEGHNHYKASWVRFQLVATNDEGKEVGRTIIYQVVGMSPCM